MRFHRIATLLALSAVMMMALCHWNLASAQDKDKDTSDDQSKKTDKKDAPPKIKDLDEEIRRRLRVAKMPTDGAALLEFFQKRILAEKDRPEIEHLVDRLASPVYQVRERASSSLVKRGAMSVEILRAARTSARDLEYLRRIENALTRIQENEVPADVCAAAVRALASLKLAKTSETLIGYLPFADNDMVVDEIRIALTKNALVDGKADPALIAALTDRAPIRRATAAEAIGKTAFAEHKEALRKLLADPDANVRFRAARTLAFANQRDAVPVLIDAIPDLPLNSAWLAEDVLLQLAGGGAPSAPLGADQASREKCKSAWQAWWQKNQASVDLATLVETPKLLGRTLLVLLDQNAVIELGPDNMPRLQIRNVVFPLDAQALDNDHVLIAEYHGNRVTERNNRGEVVWQRQIGTPLAAQRLANGNTFVATPFGLHEFDKNNQEVLNVTLSTDNQYIMKAMKLPNGEIACMCADSRIVRYSATGKELHSFQISLGMRLFGGRIHMMPSGRVLVPHNAENKVVEYDSKGKVVWEVAFEQPIAATRLPNGNTLITSMNPQIGAVEVNRAGAQVWSYQDSSQTRVTRATRR